MNDTLYHSYSLTGIAAALTTAMGIEAPHQAEAANPTLTGWLKHVCAGAVDRILMYNPDAVALWLYQKYTEYYLPVQRNIALTLPLRTVMPSVTPVCFATMYTGVQPEVHGIRAYVKPVITIDTVFDALIRAGKRPAIVSTANDSMSCIFLNRPMDYFIYETTEQVLMKAHELICLDQHDLIAVYDRTYDAAMHRYAPEGAESLRALQDNMTAFEDLAKSVRAHWRKHNTLIGFAPDHGCHEIDGGVGSHGLDMPEDLNILHFYGFLPQD